MLITSFFIRNLNISLTLKLFRSILTPFPYKILEYAIRTLLFNILHSKAVKQFIATLENGSFCSKWTELSTWTIFTTRILPKNFPSAPLTTTYLSFFRHTSNAAATQLRGSVWDSSQRNLYCSNAAFLVVCTPLNQMMYGPVVTHFRSKPNRKTREKPSQRFEHRKSTEQKKTESTKPLGAEPLRYKYRIASFDSFL